MHNSNYLNQIAALIKQNPSITVREIASELKFADSKSVYYWLEKGNVGGINEFKRQVLGEESPHSGLVTVDVNGVRHYLLALPLYTWNPKQKSPVGAWYHLHDQPEPRGLFAVRVGTNQISPWFTQNDILIVSAADCYKEGAWMLLKTSQEYFAAKIINNQVVDPNTLQTYVSHFTPVGIILGHQRYFFV